MRESVCTCMWIHFNHFLKRFYQASYYSEVVLLSEKKNVQVVVQHCCWTGVSRQGGQPGLEPRLVDPGQGEGGRSECTYYDVNDIVLYLKLTLT